MSFEIDVKNDEIETETFNSEICENALNDQRMYNITNLVCNILIIIISAVSFYFQIETLNLGNNIDSFVNNNENTLIELKELVKELIQISKNNTQQLDYMHII